jgi:hypothetical protein
MRQLASLLGACLLAMAALLAVLTGPYSFETAPLLASAVLLLAFITLQLSLSGNSDGAIVTGIVLLLVMTMPLVGLTPGQGFPSPLTVGDLRSWVPLYVGLGLLVFSGRESSEATSDRTRPARVGLHHRLLLGLYELCASISAALLVCRLAASR